MNPLSTRPNRWRLVTVFQLLVGLLVSLSATAQPAFLKEGLVAYYPFNGNANDESGNGANASINTISQAADRFGVSNRALNFPSRNSIDPVTPNGTSLVTLPTESLHLANSSTATVSLWYLSRQTNNWQALFVTWPYVYYIPPPGPGGLMISVADRLVVNTASDSDRTFSTSKLSTNVWNHVVVVYDGSAINNNDKVRIYLNGVREKVEQIRPDVIPSKIPATANSAYLGAHSFKATGSFVGFLDGNLDDVRIYKRALSDTEAKALFNYESTLPNLAVFPAVEVEFYTLNGVKYQLEVSTDMATWIAEGGVVVGTGGNQNYFVRASKAAQFWRLKLVP